MAEASSTTPLANSPTMEIGKTINFMAKDISITKPLKSFILHSTSAISIISHNFGQNIKVRIYNKLGQFMEDDKHGKGTIYLSNG